MLSHVGFISIHVSDLDRAIAFYTDKLGLEKTTDAAMGPGARWVELTPKGAQTRVSLLAPGNPAYSVERMGDGIASTFEVTDFAATCKELAARGVPFRHEPKQESWGWWAEVVDPDGNVLGLHADA